MTPNGKKFLQLQKQFSLSAQQMYDAANLIQANQIKRLPSGNFQVRSKSRPNQFHSVNPKDENCTCEQASKGKMCFHLMAWRYLKDDEIKARAQLNRDIITQRELAQKMQRASYVKTEWAEEID